MVAKTANGMVVRKIGQERVVEEKEQVPKNLLRKSTTELLSEKEIDDLLQRIKQGAKIKISSGSLEFYDQVTSKLYLNNCLVSVILSMAGELEKENGRWVLLERRKGRRYKLHISAISIR